MFFKFKHKEIKLKQRKRPLLKALLFFISGERKGTDRVYEDKVGFIIYIT